MENLPLLYISNTTLLKTFVSKSSLPLTGLFRSFFPGDFNHIARQQLPYSLRLAVYSCKLTLNTFSTLVYAELDALLYPDPSQAF